MIFLLELVFVSLLISAFGAVCGASLLLDILSDIKTRRKKALWLFGYSMCVFTTVPYLVYVVVDYRRRTKATGPAFTAVDAKAA